MTMKNKLRESDIETYLIRQVEGHGGEVRKVKWIGRRNCPDRLVMFINYHCWVELKKPSKKATKAQAREHTRLIAMGQKVYVINNLIAVDALINKIIK